MSDNKDCMNCKHSFYEDLDYNLCCRLKDNHILQGVLQGVLNDESDDGFDDDGFDDGLHFSYEYIYPYTCENYEDE